MKPRDNETVMVVHSETRIVRVRVPDEEGSVHPEFVTIHQDAVHDEIRARLGAPNEKTHRDAGPPVLSFDFPFGGGGMNRERWNALRTAVDVAWATFDQHNRDGWPK